MRDSKIARQNDPDAPEEEPRDVFALLREDHRRVQDLFKQFEGGETRSRRGIAEQALADLEIHAAIEEELVYPAIRKAINEDDLMDEAREEHHVAKFLIKELHKMDPQDDGYSAKFKTLGEIVRHHIEEEEHQMFPQAEEADLDAEELGREAGRRTEKLRQKYSGQTRKSGRKTSGSDHQRRRKAA